MALRTKESIQAYVDRLESQLRNIEFHLNRLERKEANEEIDKARTQISNIRTMLEREDND